MIYLKKEIFEKNYDFILSDKDIHNKMFSDNKFGIRRVWIKFNFKDENYRFEAYRYINDGNNSIEDSYKTWGVYKDGKYVYGIVK